jgi:hypothetical protein
MKDTRIHAWLATLEGSCAQLDINHLDVILDQADRATLLPSIQSVQPPIPWYSLYSGLPEEGALEVAPLLVRIDLANRLQRFWLAELMGELECQSRMLVLASHWQFETLAEYLVRCGECRYRGALGIFRFYDPRLFPLLFSDVLDAEQQQLWRRPAEFWSWLDRDGNAQRVSGEGGLPVNLDDFVPVELSFSQMDVFHCASAANKALSNPACELSVGWSAEQRFESYFSALRGAAAGEALCGDPAHSSAFKGGGLG